MRIIITGFLMLISICVHCMESFAAEKNNCRQIRLDVHVQDFRGKPLDEVLLSIFDGETVRVDAATDDNGNATIELDLSVDTSSIEVRHSFAHPTTFHDTQQQIALSQRMTALRREYSIERAYPVHLDPERVAYRVEIVFQEAITVSGIIVGEHDEPVGHVVFGPKSLQLGDAGGRKRFWIRGVQKGKEATLLIVMKMVGSSSPIMPVHLTEEQTQEDVDLGLLVMPSIEADSQFDVYLSNFGVVSGTRMGVTFVRPDGGMLFGARAYDELHERAGEIMGNPLELPVGEYYVVPGNAGISPPPEVWALVEALHQGRDLDEFDVHKITIEKDERQTFHFDLAELQKPIRKMMAE